MSVAGIKAYEHAGKSGGRRAHFLGGLVGNGRSLDHVDPPGERMAFNCGAVVRPDIDVDSQNTPARLCRVQSNTLLHCIAIIEKREH